MTLTAGATPSWPAKLAARDAAAFCVLLRCTACIHHHCSDQTGNPASRCSRMLVQLSVRELCSVISAKHHSASSAWGCFIHAAICNGCQMGPAAGSQISSAARWGTLVLADLLMLLLCPLCIFCVICDRMGGDRVNRPMLHGLHTIWKGSNWMENVLPLSFGLQGE